MLTNKSTTDAEHATISLNGAEKQYKKAAVYAITSESSEIRLIGVSDVTNSKVDITLPAYCAAMIVVSDDEHDQ